MISSAQIMGLSDVHLVEVDASHYLQSEVKQAFCRMQLEAKSNGIDIQICSSFRDFNKQLSIWNRKWRGELPLWTLKGQKLDANSLSNTEKIHAIMLWSALPGASRHHWGTDFDVFDKTRVEQCSEPFMLVPSEYEGNGPCADMNQWVQKNAKDFGFSFPYAKFVGGVAVEPWHLSFTALSSLIETQFSVDDLAAQLEKADIAGKQDILSLLPELVKRYTFNKGI